MYQAKIKGGAPCKKFSLRVNIQPAPEGRRNKDPICVPSPTAILVSALLLNQDPAFHSSVFCVSSEEASGCQEHHVTQHLYEVRHGSLGFISLIPLSLARLPVNNIRGTYYSLGMCCVLSTVLSTLQEVDSTARWCETSRDRIS